MNATLRDLESETMYLLREGFHAISPLGMLWSFGKDSNVLVWICRKAFFGKIPFPLIHCDTGLEMDEVYNFRDRYVKEWQIDLLSIDCPPLEATDPTLPHPARIAARKTLGLKQAIDKYKFKGIIAGIRRDEEPTRAKERFFSPRDNENKWHISKQPPEFWNQYCTNFEEGTHVRIHPLLNWREIDIWEYIRDQKIPIVDLYFAKQNPEDGLFYRYRSIGEKGITTPVLSNAKTIDEIIEELQHTKIPERSGRVMDHASEDAFERLRQDGYM